LNWQLWEAAMLLFCEGIMFLAGLMYLVTGKIKLSGREIEGSKARWTGALLMSPPVIFLPMGLIIGMQANSRGQSMDSLMESIGMLTIFELLAVIGVLVVFFVIVFNAPKIADTMKKTDLLKTILTVPEAAQYLSVTTEEIMRLIETGQIPAGRFGNDFRIARDVLDEYVRQA
jgi:excisionase family DNA binding protein